LFESCEKQGVLLLNVYLTCEIGRPNSHRQIWEELTTELLTYISTKRPNLKWFLWGNEAISKKQHIRNGVIFSSRHPMLCSSKYQDDFLKSTCFTDTMNIINWLG
jgi:uracil-DNA glycosylase